MCGSGIGSGGAVFARTKFLLYIHLRPFWCESRVEKWPGEESSVRLCVDVETHWSQRLHLIFQQLLSPHLRCNGPSLIQGEEMVRSVDLLLFLVVAFVIRGRPLFKIRNLCIATARWRSGTLLKRGYRRRPTKLICT